MDTFKKRSGALKPVSVLRISGGILKGRTVRVPPGIIRPSMDRMRESVFAVLGDLQGSSFLDLFSGSGIIALEAASRGASLVEAVESDPLKRKTILDNAALSPVPVRCHFMAAELYIKRARKPFDYIFCDPPFPYKYKKNLLLSIETSSLLSGPSLVLIHRSKSEHLDLELRVPPKQEPFTGLVLRETRFYGASAVDFFTKKG